MGREEGEVEVEGVMGWVCAPVVVVGAGVLLVNDHVLKGAGVLPGWVTGKLSDVSGLFVFPIVVTVVVAVVASWFGRVGERRVRLMVWGAGIVTVVGFSGINVWQGVADATMGMVGTYTADLTDLWCLVSVVGAVWWMEWQLSRGERRRVGRGLKVVALVFCAVACVATSPPRLELGETRPMWRIQHSEKATVGELGAQMNLVDLAIRHPPEPPLGDCRLEATLEVLGEAGGAPPRVAAETGIIEANRGIQARQGDEAAVSSSGARRWAVVPASAENGETEYGVSREVVVKMPCVLSHSGWRFHMASSCTSGERWIDSTDRDRVHCFFRNRMFVAIVIRTGQSEEALEATDGGRRGVVCGVVTEPTGEIIDMSGACGQRGDLVTSTWPVRSGQTGVRVETRVWNVGQQTRRVEAGRGELVLRPGKEAGDGEWKRVGATAAPDWVQVGAKGAGTVSHAFEFDNLAAWREGVSFGKFGTELGVGETGLWEIRVGLRQARLPYGLYYPGFLGNPSEPVPNWWPAAVESGSTGGQ